MIDREWLAKLDFESIAGKVVETKLGTEKVVFIVENDKGEQHAMKTLKNHLGFHICEIPPMLTKNPIYDVDIVNDKLNKMLGNPFYDAMPHDYDRLYSLLTKILFEKGVQGVIASLFSSESTETLPFILGTPGIKRRIHELKELTSSKSFNEDRPIDINGPNFPIKIWPGVTKWEGVNLDSISAFCSGYEPQTLHDNPLFIWGGAILDGFFNNDELKHAAKYINANFGNIPSRSDANVLVSQIDAISSLLVQFFDNIKIERLVKFCAYCGVIFDVHDKKGNDVCSGLKYLSGS